MISTAEFQKMKPGIIIVNTARGGVLDEDALVHALNTGKVLSVGLDVYQSEPNLHPGLLRNPHVCLLPHMGTSTVEVGSPRVFRNEINVLIDSADEDEDGDADTCERSICSRVWTTKDPGTGAAGRRATARDTARADSVILMVLKASHSQSYQRTAVARIRPRSHCRGMECPESRK